MCTTISFLVHEGTYNFCLVPFFKKPLRRLHSVHLVSHQLSNRYRRPGNFTLTKENDLKKEVLDDDRTFLEED